MTVPSEPGGPFGELLDARRILEEGLALLDGATADDPEVPVAIGRVVEALRAAGDPRDLRAAVPPDEVERFDNEAEEVLRLNAVLISAVKRDREALMGRLKAARESRRDLKRQSSGASGGAGARCDLSG